MHTKKATKKKKQKKKNADRAFGTLKKAATLLVRRQRVQLITIRIFAVGGDEAII